MLKFGFIMRKIWIFDWRFLCRLSHKLKILLCYYRSDSRFNPYTHGGHSDEHKEEIDRAINEIVDKKLKEAIPQIYQ